MALQILPVRRSSPQSRYGAATRDWVRPKAWSRSEVPHIRVQASELSLEQADPEDGHAFFLYTSFKEL